MAGIYVHIPFCRQKCTYCDFHFSTNLRLQDAMVAAICREAEIQKTFLKTPPETLYFGGGTPSLLPEKSLAKIVDALHTHFDLSRLTEVTLETNPDDHNPEKLAFWQGLGINRLSIGIQSFIDRDLQLMNRAHTATHAKRCVEQAREAGFNAMSIDLIYGIPNQSFSEWQSNVEQAVQLNPDHISAYCLTVEPKTALARQVAKGEITEKTDEAIERDYLHLHHALAQEGFEHYEVSNFAQRGKRATHNSNYWTGHPYLGLGPSAHSFDGHLHRHWNVANNALYIQKTTAGAPCFEAETLSQRECLNEQLMTGLRTVEGVDFSDWPTETQHQLQRSIAAFPPALAQCVEQQNTCIKIKPEHWLLSDAVIRALVVV